MKKNNPRKPFFNDERKDSGSPKSSGKSDFSSKGPRFEKGEGKFNPKGKSFGKKDDSFGKPSFDKKSDFSSDSKRSFGDKPKGKFFKSEEKSFGKPAFGKRFGSGDSEKKSFGDKRYDKGEGFQKKFEKREDSAYPKKSFGEKSDRFKKDDASGKKFERREGSDFSKKSYGDKPDRFNKEGFSEKKFERRDSSEFPKKSFGDKSERFKKDDFSGKKFEKREGSDFQKKTFGDKSDRFKKEDSGSRKFGKDSESRSEKPSFKKDFSDHKKSNDSGERLVYKGRGRDEKPVFGPESRQFSEDKPVEKRGFGKNRPNRQELNPDRPDYNFDALPARKTKGKEETDLLRLNKYIANSGICSRREADDLITQGLITVNGQVITEMGYKVKKSDRVIYQGKRINPEKPVYVLLNKPKDFITTTDDPMERKTVMKLVENACEERIFPVGRLDRNTTGLLLFTNDGELTAKLSHPSNEVKKIYQVTLDKPLTQRHEEEIREGLTLEDGDVKVDDMQVLSKDRTILGLEIHIGRNRIVRRLFAHLGYEVIALDRVMYAGLDKKDLKRGHYRFLTEQEVIRLKYFT
ncbi:rRNA pseudouridine synthase [Algoriphagus lacus]|uniref:Pseudouridine synthase n=1 Tax=Algoriphagus lacus TaxID=2056311 RepID=A0A418PSZ4_9BACT|nr:pseudouridine synthase [Algoriphagus lacus]RIW16188.1 rRNA pseudouridine synthase [Algoriphagus lacus]